MTVNGIPDEPDAVVARSAPRASAPDTKPNDALGGATAAAVAPSACCEYLSAHSHAMSALRYSTGATRATTYLQILKQRHCGQSPLV